MISKISNYLSKTFTEHIELKAIGAVLIGGLSQLCGGNREVVRILVILLICDLVVGILIGGKRREISSIRLQDTFIKGITYFILLIIGWQTSKLEYLAFLDSIIISLLIITEVISIFENIEILMPNLIPEWLIYHLRLKKQELQYKMKNGKMTIDNNKKKRIIKIKKKNVRGRYRGIGS